MANESAVNRRQFLMSLCIPAIAKFPTKSESPLPGVRKPKFWFGDTVRYVWASDDFGKDEIHWQEGEIVGVTWNPEKQQWDYTVYWLRGSNTIDESDCPWFEESPVNGKDLLAL